jgi:hypothetical protein
MMVSASQQRRRRGLTLLELILSIAASTLLLVAVSSALVTHYQLTDTCQRNIEQSRARLAISQSLRQDLSEVQAAPDKENADEFAESTVAERVLKFDYTLSPNVLAIFGTSDLLSIGSTGPSREENNLRAAMQVYSTIWTARPTSNVQIPFADITKQIRFLSADSSKGNSAGCRRTVYQLGKQVVQVHENSFAREIEAIRFRYLDRGSWRDSWNSVQKQRLPDAIEVSVTCRGGVGSFEFVHGLLSHRSPAAEGTSP